MRTIKYRAKVRSEKGKSKWVKGFYYEVFGSPYILPESREREPSQIIDRETLGAFIQRTDKNGVEVYEGDIICSEIFDEERNKTVREFHIIEYFDNEDNGIVGFTYRSLQYNTSIFDMFSQKWFSEHIEVVGNRWDNSILRSEKRKRGRADV